MKQNNLRRLRQQRGLTQRELADLAGIDITTIKRLEGGQTKRPHGANLRSLADALGVELESLMPPSAAAARPGLAPAPPAVTHLVGRAGDIQRGCELLSASGGPRTVTLSGPRGVGKTALAQAVAFGAAEAMGFQRTVWLSAKAEELEPRGVCRVRASLSSLSDLLYAIGCAFGHSEIGTMPPEEQEQLTHQLLCSSAALLVVDNLDCLLDDEREQIARYLHTLPQGTRALTTSLGPLGMADEGSVVVRPLGRSDSYLLIDREAAHKQVALRGSDKGAIYGAVGGIPLLLTWCVGRMALDNQTVSGVLRLLRDPAADVHEWCFGQFWDALPSEDCRQVMAAAAICRGPAEREFLGRIAAIGDPAARDRTLAQLSARATLLTYDRATDRYSMLPLTRDGALRQLSAMPDARQMWLRVVTYYTELAAGIDDDANACWDALEADAESIMGVADWCCAVGEWEALAGLLRHINQYLYARFRWADLRRLGSLVLQNAEQVHDPNLLANLRRDLAWVYLELGEHETARALALDALAGFERQGDFRLQSTCLRYMAQMALRERDYPAADEYLKRSVCAAEKATPNGALLAMLDNLYACLHQQEGDLDAAQRDYESSLRRRRELPTPDRFGMCSVLRNLGELALNRGDHRQAEARLMECLALCEEVARRDLIGGAKVLLAQVRAEQGRTDEAVELAEEAEKVFAGLGLSSDLRRTRDLLQTLRTTGT